jgi:glycosyltransferase involved in cell wall biosynthesis
VARICLITPGQPATNPRLVKEADALTEAGHDVHVLCAHLVAWADAADRELLRNRRWTCTYVAGSRDAEPLKYHWSRVRWGVARRNPWTWRYSEVARECAITRATPELIRAAEARPADLYIAHYAGALVAAAHAARKNHALLGFDAEDLESGSYATANGPSPIDSLVARLEHEYLPHCDYMIAASPLIAEAYRERYGVRLPETVLNVFPLSERPAGFPEHEASGPVRLYWFSQTIGLDRGLEEVLHALGRLQGCAFELHIRGNWWDPAERVRFLELADRVGFGRQHVIENPPAAPAEMIRLASDCDIGLALEQRGSENRDICLTNKIFTYVLAGNAVIATATRGQTALVSTMHDCALLYEPGDIDGLAGALGTWHADRARLRAARKAAWDWGTRRFNWDLEKKKLVNIVERALSATSARIATSA